MKLYYTDEKKNKQLIAEADSIMEICEAADVNARGKFIFLKNLQLKSLKPECYVFMSTEGEETGYSVEK